MTDDDDDDVPTLVAGRHRTSMSRPPSFDDGSARLPIVPPPDTTVVIDADQLAAMMVPRWCECGMWLNDRGWITHDTTPELAPVALSADKSRAFYRCDAGHEWSVRLNASGRPALVWDVDPARVHLEARVLARDLGDPAWRRRVADRLDGLAADLAADRAAVIALGWIDPRA